MIRAGALSVVWASAFLGAGVFVGGRPAQSSVRPSDASALAVFLRESGPRDRVSARERRALGFSRSAVVRWVATVGTRRVYAARNGVEVCIGRVEEGRADGSSGTAARCGVPRQMLGPKSALMAQSLLFGLAPDGVRCVTFGLDGSGSLAIPVRRNGYAAELNESLPQSGRFSRRQCE